MGELDHTLSAQAPFSFAPAPLAHGNRPRGGAAFALSGSFAWALASFLAFGACGGLLYPIYTAWINQSIDPRVRATVLSFLSLGNAFGQTAGGPLVGGVGARFSLRPALVLSAALLSPSLWVFSRTMRSDDATEHGAAS